MRDICQVCGGLPLKSDWKHNFIVPDGWTLPARHEVLCCASCGFIWQDNDSNQERYDQYYRERYGYGLVAEDTPGRMKAVVDVISAYYDHQTSILDYGGEGELEAAFREAGFQNVLSYNLDSEPPKSKYEVVTSTHVIEHVYDIQDYCNKLDALVEPGGVLYLEYPTYDHWITYASPIIDMHQKHINHFCKRHTDMLFIKRGYEPIYHKSFFQRESETLRLLYRKLDIKQNFVWLELEFNKRINPIIERVKAIDFPVNVWGLGDMAWYLLDKVNLDILEFIDNDPAYRDSTIMGKPILERPTNSGPIVVMAVGQKDKLVKRIMGECDNELIIIG